MIEHLFSFKQFSVSHHQSSMKVGVDGVLLGAWCDVLDKRNILDVGCGCGLIALMCAQRNLTAGIKAIDIDKPSINEAKRNFEKSPWSDRLIASYADFSVYYTHESFDLIVSNPPFYLSGIIKPETSRLKARHGAELSPNTLPFLAKPMLKSNGVLSMIFPYDQLENVIAIGEQEGYSIRRVCKVRGTVSSSWKRVMVEFIKNKITTPIFESLTLESARGIPTDAYKELCSDFYLKF